MSTFSRAPHRGRRVRDRLDLEPKVEEHLYRHRPRKRYNVIKDAPRRRMRDGRVAATGGCLTIVISDDGTGALMSPSRTRVTLAATMRERARRSGPSRR